MREVPQRCGKGTTVSQVVSKQRFRTLNQFISETKYQYVVVQKQQFIQLLRFPVFAQIAIEQLQLREHGLAIHRNSRCGEILGGELLDQRILRRVNLVLPKLVRVGGKRGILREVIFEFLEWPYISPNRKNRFILVEAEMMEQNFKQG